MSVADRLAPFGTTVFSRITRLAIEHDAVNLGQGFPDFDGPPDVLRAASDALIAGPNQYVRSHGLPALNQAIAEHASPALAGAFPQGIDPDAHVTVTAGCTEAIAASLLGLLNPGDEVILFEPTYDSYLASVALAGAKANIVTLRAHEGGFTFDADELRSAVTERTRAIVVNSPHNPTGKVFSPSELDDIAHVCIEHDLVAISDEVYEHLVYDGAPFPRLANVPGMGARTISCSSIGKTFSLTGWKIGWAIAPPELSASVRAAHQFTTFCAPGALQAGSAAALKSPPSFYESLARDFQRKRDTLCEALDDIGFRCVVPAAGYFVMADHRALWDGDDVSLVTHLIENAGVAAIPPSAFYASSDEGSRFVRFAFCKRDETLRTAIERLRAWRDARRRTKTKEPGGNSRRA
ncbi:MAG: aminotransferase class I/II-fold pyridoxal phosphate-dependent enzyme [Planctomycetota bacterium]